MSGVCALPSDGPGTSQVPPSKKETEPWVTGVVALVTAAVKVTSSPYTVALAEDVTSTLTACGPVPMGSWQLAEPLSVKASSPSATRNSQLYLSGSRVSLITPRL